VRTRSDPAGVFQTLWQPAPGRPPAWAGSQRGRSGSSCALPALLVLTPTLSCSVCLHEQSRVRASPVSVSAVGRPATACPSTMAAGTRAPAPALRRASGRVPGGARNARALGLRDVVVMGKSVQMPDTGASGILAEAFEAARARQAPAGPWRC